MRGDLLTTITADGFGCHPLGTRGLEKHCSQPDPLKTMGSLGLLDRCEKTHVWNELPEEVVEAGTLITFERHLDGHMKRKDLEGYGPNAGKCAWVRLGCPAGADELDRRDCFQA
eukprot:g21528.t1